MSLSYNALSMSFSPWIARDLDKSVLDLVWVLGFSLVLASACELVSAAESAELELELL